MDFVPYASEVSILIYVMVCTRPNFDQEVRTLSRFMVDPRSEHQVTNVKRIFRYLQGTSKYSIFYHSDVSRDRHSNDI